MDNNNVPALTIVGDVGVDVVLGPIERWPAIGTESLILSVSPTSGPTTS